ncbi:MAG: CBM96 family carbohydrate-binding protein [bacterium]
MGRSLAKAHIRALFISVLFLLSWGGEAAEMVKAPEADTSTYAGYGSSVRLPVSRWDHAIMRFDVGQEASPLTSAVLRVYFDSNEALDLRLWKHSHDNWSESGPVPNKEAFSGGLLGVKTVAGKGCVEFDVTDYVAAAAGTQHRCPSTGGAQQHRHCARLDTGRTQFASAAE